MAIVTLAYSDTLARSKQCHYRRAHLYYIPGLEPVLEVCLPLPEDPEALRGRADVGRADALAQLLLQLGDLVQPRDDHRLQLPPGCLQRWREDCLGNYILSDKIPCLVGFVNCFLRVPLHWCTSPAALNLAA